MSRSVLRFLLPVVATFQAVSLATYALEPVTTVEGITEYRLDNGLQILLFPDESKPTITVNITYHVGSRHEGRGEAGMAHLLEHMVFKGTPTRPNIWGALEDHGANFNGTTWLDRTNYYETLPASDENLEFAIQMEADRMVNSEILGKELAKEMTVVRNEFERGENSPESVLGERMVSAAFLWHNYGKSTIGNRSDIERVPVENLRKFYEKYYQPDNATLLVVGKFDTPKALALIQKHFGSIPRPTRQLDATYTEEPAQDGHRLVTLQRVGDVAVVGATYHIPAGAHPDFAAVEIFEDVLTNQPGGHLYRRLVSSGLAANVYGSVFMLAEPGISQFMAQVASEHSPQEVLATLIDGVENAGPSITQEQVAKAIARNRKQTKLAMTSSSRLGIRMSEFIAQGDWRLFFVHRDRIERVKFEDVQAVAEKYFVASNRTAGIFEPTSDPQRATIPLRPNVEELVSGYRGKQDIAQGEELRPDVSFIESRIVRETLPSGIKLAMLPIELRGDAVFATFRLRYGNEETLSGNSTAAELISPMLMRGTKELTYQQLRDRIDELQSTINVGSGGFSSSVGLSEGTIQSDRQHISKAVELLGQIFRQPAFDSSEFDIVVSQRRSRLEQGLSDPQALSMRALQRAFNPWPEDHPHYTPTMAESLDRLNRVSVSDIKSLHDQLFGSTHMEIAIVGDFDPVEIRDTIVRTFGDWRSPSEYQRVAKPFQPLASETVVIDTPDKPMAMAIMASLANIRDDDPRYPALNLASYVLGESAKSRLLNRLRHEGGLSYTAMGTVNASSQDPRASLMAMAICAPQNLEEARTAMKEELEKWLNEGITQQELDESRKSYALNFKSSLASPEYLMQKIADGLEVDRTLRFEQQKVDKIQELTIEEIRQALHEVFRNSTMFAIEAGDMETAKSESSSEAASAASAPPVAG